MLKDGFSYWGGHKEVQIKGFFKMINGEAVLHQDSIEFVKQNGGMIMNIPLKSIQFENFGIDNKVTGQAVQGASLFGFDFGGTTQNITSARLIIPYIDHNGVLQKPEFEFGGIIKKTGKWAEEIYKILLPLQNNSDSVKNKIVENHDDDEVIRILKIRYAKGEISKEEFHEIKKDLEIGTNSKITPQIPKQENICDNCRNNNTPDAKTCIFCGKPI